MQLQRFFSLVPWSHFDFLLLATGSSYFQEMQERPVSRGGNMQNIPVRILSIVLLSVVAGFSVGCSHAAKDSAIATDIQTKVAADPDLKDANVQVAAKDGKVTLTGKVESAEDQQKVEQIAHGAQGTEAVDDQIVVQPPPQPIVVPAGTVLTVRLGQTLGSKISQTGQSFLATLAQPISVNGTPALASGSTVSGTVVSAKSKGKIKGEGELTLALTSISVGGHTYSIQTGVLSNTIKGKGKRTAVTTGGGAAGGALIGGIAGGGKGAGIGALVGAGAGLIGGAATGNQQIELPVESALSFTMSAPLTLPPPAN
jgi:BON domain